MSTDRIVLIYCWVSVENSKQHCTCYGPTMAKMSGDALAMKITCSGVDGCRCRTCGPTRKLTRDVLTNLRGASGEAYNRFIDDHSAMHRGIFWRRRVMVRS